MRTQRMARLGGLEVDLPGGKTRISREASFVLGIETKDVELPVKRLLTRLEPRERRRLLRELTDAVRSHSPLSTEIRYDGDGSRPLTLSVRGEVDFDDARPYRIRFIVQDVSELKEAEARVRYLAHHDVLTGLANRFSFTQRLSEVLTQGGRRVHPGALHLVDLDRFKEVNDTLGHAVGDELLCEVARRLSRCLRADDFVARLGGDEFAVIQVNATTDAQAMTFANRIIRCLEEPFELDGHRVRCGASIGVMLYPCRDLSGEDLLARADLALYSAKKQGRNLALRFEAQMDQQLRARKQTEQDVRDGHEQRWFELHFQPQFETGSRELVGAEALLRLNHPVRGLVGPDHFIPIVEDVGLILPLGRWVIREACTRISRVRRDDGSPIRVAVNLSAIQLQDPALIPTIEEALSSADLPPTCLEIEITESMVMEDPVHAAEVLGRIRALGVMVAIDDFGTGYSSFQQLRYFPLDRIKIDRAFIADIATDEEALAIVRTILELCRTLDLRTTAEGVETIEQLDVLGLTTCETVQGFLLSKPLPFRDLMKFVEGLDERYQEARGGSAQL